MKKSRLCAVLIIILLLMGTTIVITGCWDRQEIEELGIVVGISIDHPHTTVGKKQEEKESEEYKDRKEHRLTVTQQFVVPKAVGEGSASTKADQRPYTNISTEGDSFVQISRQFDTMTSRSSYYKHLKVIIICEHVAESINMKKLLDTFLREPGIERDVQIMISKGCGKKVLEIEPVKEDLPSNALVALGKNMDSTSRMVRTLTLGDMSKKMTAESSFLVPRVIAHGKSVQLAGANIVKGKTNKLIGWLGEEETDGINWILGGVKGGVVEAIDKKTKEVIGYGVHNVKSKIVPKVDGEEISFTVEIESEGSIEENWTMDGNEFEEEFIERARESIKEEISSIIDDGLRKTQKEFKVDVVGFGKKLSIKYPKVWEKVKDHWDEQFSKIPVKIKLEIYVRDFGEKGRMM
ncbi:MAG: Ger(x)C family spore germination protein [Marinisporobacter sp.]|jgi:spore germination protein|nr:Ger(x)C family spore germination protein [Marinisporobacter sp.]